MATHDLSDYTHNHAFDAGNRAGEVRTWIVVGITAVTMVAEIVAGWLTGSMALLADGWHMATHVVALSIAGFSYLLARRWARDERFAFGTWKIEVLGAFTSALLLGVVALAMVWESAHRLMTPEDINFVAALVVAVIAAGESRLRAGAGDPAPRCAPRPRSGSQPWHGYDHHDHARRMGMRTRTPQPAFGVRARAGGRIHFGCSPSSRLASACGRDGRGWTR